MTREIKFRAWDKDQLYFLEDAGIRLNGDGRLYEYDSLKDEWIFNPHLIVSEFTGIKDKNGKEIYEGDILGRTKNGLFAGEPARVERSVVKWSDEQSGFCSDDSTSIRYSIENPIPYEVIGNIWEHPDLLK